MSISISSDVGYTSNHALGSTISNILGATSDGLVHYIDHPIELIQNPILWFSIGMIMIWYRYDVIYYFTLPIRLFRTNDQIILQNKNVE